MFGSGEKKKFLLSTEEKEVVRLEALVSELTGELSTEKQKNTTVMTEASNKKNEYIAQGRKLERDRLLSVIHLPEYAGREAYAMAMVLTTAKSSSPHEIGIMLKNIPKAEKLSEFEKMMSTIKNPEISAGHDSDGSTNNVLESIAAGVI